MNKVLVLLGSMLVVACVGCVSPGGAYVVGPLSSWNASRIDKAQMTRCVANSTRIAAEKKEPIVRAVSMSLRPGEIAAGYQVDILSLFDGNYTLGELTTQALAATGDLVGEAAATYGLYKTLTRDSHDTVTTTYTINVNNTGHGNTTPINVGSGSQSGIQTGTQGGATGALTPSDL